MKVSKRALLLDETGILGRDQLDRLASAVVDLSGDQLIWASGYLAGLAATARRTHLAPAVVPALAPVEAAKPARQLTILYGSQTGNSKRLSQVLSERAGMLNVPARWVNLADYTPRQLKQEQYVLIVISTQGDGDPPEDAAAFCEYLMGNKAPRFERLQYGVLALGDSSYPQFCKTGRDLDERLAALGATRILPRVDCDLDFKVPAETWIGDALKHAVEALTVNAPAAGRITIVEPARRAQDVAPAEHPLVRAEVLGNQRITGRGSDKDVRHLELALEDDGLDYAPGDSFGVSASNPPALVEELLEIMAWPDSAEAATERGPRTLLDALTHDVELTLLSRQFLASYQDRARDAQLAALLAETQSGALAAYMQDRQIVDVLRESPAVIAPADFLSLLRPLGPRLYSLASSRAATPGEAHLTVAVVNYAREGRPRFGAASSFLATLAPGAELSLRLESNASFRLPADDVPLIMIGPGTGVAPFRGFVAERAARGARGRNWLFFGERTFANDFLYQIEWQKHLKSGALNRMDVAFSRDQAQKVYVQHRLLERAQELYAWLQDGASVYVCGDAKYMAKDVHAALQEVLVRAGDLSAEDAAEYLKQLKRDGRYRRDVY